METREKLLQDEKELIEYECSSDVVHTEILLDIRDLLIKISSHQDNKIFELETKYKRAMKGWVDSSKKLNSEKADD